MASLSNEKVMVRETPSGARLELRIYLYPDGHGNIVDNISGRNYPVGDQLELVSNLLQILRDSYAASRHS